jgi:hypothetical protein
VGWIQRGAFVLAGALLLGGCSDLEIVDTNAPLEEELTGTPSRSVLASAATGIFVGAFNDLGTEIQYYTLYGREGYNLLGNDPRETGEQIRGPQDPTGRNSGLWLGQYSAIRMIHTYLTALAKTAELTVEERRASEGFAKTLKAWHLHRLALRNGELGIPVDVDRPLTADPAPFVSFAKAMETVSALLDEALVDLESGGSAFPFTMAPGFTGFSTPTTFARFNRALAAKVLVHRATFVGCTACWATAEATLGASFVTTAGLPDALATGVYYGYTGAPNEPSNPVSEPLSNNRYWVHPSIVSGAQLRADDTPDLRLTQKVMNTGRTLNLNDLIGTHKPVLFNNKGNPAQANQSAHVPWIINEELLLLRAEVRWHTGDKPGALSDLNLVREYAGGLAPTSLTVASPDDDFVTELLYNRLYSLMWTQGTRWIDARRYGRLQSLPVDREGDSLFPNMLVPAGECDARGMKTPCTPPLS